MIVKQLRAITTRHPFHNVKRLYRNRGLALDAPGGDCFELASAARRQVAGELTACRYTASGDFHTVLTTQGGYCDLSSKHVFTPIGSEYYYRYFQPSGEPLAVYYQPRKSVLDDCLVARKWITDEIFVQINGHVLRVETPLTQKEFLLTPGDMVEYLQNFFLLEPQHTRELVKLYFNPNPLFL